MENNMRSWNLFFSAIFASMISVLSVVMPFCLFLKFYHGNLFVVASERMSSRGIEVMLYLTPFLLFTAFICFWIVFRCLPVPKKIIETNHMLKVIITLGLNWFGLILFFQFLDGRIYDVVETLTFGIVSFIILLVPLMVGLLSGNIMYLLIDKRILKCGKINKIKDKYKSISSSPL